MRPYFVEVFAVANLIAIAFLTCDLPFVRPAPDMIAALFVTILMQAALGVGIRLAIDFARGRRGYWRRIRRRRWIFETLRLMFAIALTFFAYGWIKISIPAVHPVLLDQALWDLDQFLLLGVAPTIFVLNIFGHESFLRIIDWSYANIFLASLFIASAYFLSEPSRRIRNAYVSGNAVLWIGGAWLYMLVPSLGPAYRFHDVWMPLHDVLERTQQLQAVLMRNYQNILRAARGQAHGPIQIMFGIAAFPSLHVGFQTYVFLWMRRLWTSGEVLFGLFMAVIFLGSMVTGWHYLIDGLAGFVLAFACWWVFWRRARMPRMLRLF